MGLRRLRAVGKWPAGVIVASQTQAGHLSTAVRVMLPRGGVDQFRFLNRQLVLPVSMILPAISSKLARKPRQAAWAIPFSVSISDSSPDWYISVMMSQPPTNSPLT